MKNLENKTVSHSNERREKTFREAYPFSREDVYPNGEKSNVNNYIIVDDGVNVMTKDGFFSNKYTIHYTNVEFIPEDEIEARLKAERKKHPELVLNKEIVESNAGDEKAKKTKKLQTEVHTDKTGDILYADDTIAAKIVDGEPLVLNEPSSYVLPSLMGWLQKKGFKAVSKEQILHDYKYEHMKDISKVESKKKGEDIIKIIKNLASRKKTEGNLVDRLYSGFSEIRDIADMIADFESKWDVKINKLSDLEEIAYGKGGNRKLAELADRLIMEIINIVDRFRKDIPYFKDIDDPYYFDENTKSKRNKINEEYNGWKDKATWNAALWIGSDEGLYNQAIEFVSGADRITYTDFLEYLGIETGDKTPDGEYWYEADEKEMTNFLKDFKNDMLDSEGKEREEYEEKKMRKNANNLSEGKYDGEINTLIGVLFGDIGHEKGQYYLYQSLNSASVVKVTGEGGGIDTLLTAYSPKELLNMLEAIRAYKYLHSEDKKEECEKNQIKMRQRVEALSENDANDELNKEIDNIETKINELMRELKLSKEIIKVLYDKLTFEKPKEVDIETDEVISGYYL